MWDFVTYYSRSCLRDWTRCSSCMRLSRCARYLVELDCLATPAPRLGDILFDNITPYELLFSIIMFTDLLILLLFYDILCTSKP